MGAFAPARVVTLVALSMATGASGAESAGQRVSLHPQVGVNTSRYDLETAVAETEALTGWQAGFHVRIGGEIYFYPGLFLQRTGTRFLSPSSAGDDAPDLPAGDNESTSLFIPVAAGIDLIDEDPFRLRVHSGLGVTVLLDVEDPFDRDVFYPVRLGLTAGIGIDLWWLTADVSGELGLSDSIDDQTSTNRVARLSLGLRLP